MSARKRKPKTPRQVSNPIQAAGLHDDEGEPLSERLIEAIDEERGNLSKADSLLGCLIVAMEYETEFTERPYYPDVAEIAREFVKKSINGLDPIHLKERVLRDKVKDSHPCFLQAVLMRPSEPSGDLRMDLYTVRPPALPHCGMGWGSAAGEGWRAPPATFCDVDPIQGRAGNFRQALPARD